MGDKIVFVRCCQDTAQAPGAAMRDGVIMVSLSHSQIFLVIFSTFSRARTKQMGTTPLTTLRSSQ